MKSLEAWNFEFSVSPASGELSIYHKKAEAILFAATSWAEQHKYGIGGGPYEKKSGSSEKSYWVFKFGLCLTEDNQLIPWSKANELLELLEKYCRDHGYTFQGGFRQFTEEEGEPFPLRDE